MAKIRCHEMYMVNSDHPSGAYAWHVSRVWWMPWRYNLYIVFLDTRGANGYIADARDEVYPFLTKDGLKGTLKIFELLKED